MTYENAVEKIHSLLTFGSRPGLDRMRILLDRLGNPQDRLKFIHIAGTNGKGSVCAMLSSALVAAGYKTALNISTYIMEINERKQINKYIVNESDLTDAVEKTFPIIEQLREEGTIITEFEYVNALQFYIHANADCDIVVLQTAEFHTFLHGDVQSTFFRSDNKTGYYIVGATSLYSCGITLLEYNIDGTLAGNIIECFHTVFLGYFVLAGSNAVYTACQSHNQTE